MKTVLLSLVGMNPASALVSVCILKPDRVVLVHTDKTRPQAEAVRSQCEDIPVKLVEWPMPGGIDVLGERVADDVALAADEALTVDVTGATTLFSLGAWDGLTAALGRRFRAVYLRQSDSRLCDARTGEPVSDEDADISPKKVLAWYGARVRDATWSGRLDSVPRAVSARLPLTRALVRSWTPRRVKIARAQNGIRINRKYLPGQLPPGVRYEGGVLSYPGDKEFFGHNRWLEEYCLAVVADELEKTQRVHAALGLRPCAETDKGSVDEGDVVLVRGGRVVVVEAKANLERKGAGADVQKRVQKARRFYGSHVRVVVVRPVWQEEPPRALVELMGGHAVLLGSDEVALRREVRAALGFA